MSSALISTIASLKKQLAALEASLGGAPETPVKASKTKKDPDAPKKEPNVWIKFTQRVGALIKTAHPDAKGPATIGKQFCSFLKEQKAYDDWTDDEILEAYAGWERPEVSKMELAKSSKTSQASEAEESEGSKSEKKPRKPQSEETKKAAAVKRAATKAKKLAEAAATALPASSEISAEASDAESVPVEAIPQPPPPVPKAFKKKVVAKTYTMEQLTDFDSFTHEGVDYGRNVRGNVVDGDGQYVGFWNGKTVDTSTEAPADWDSVMAAM